MDVSNIEDLYERTVVRLCSAAASRSTSIAAMARDADPEPARRMVLHLENAAFRWLAELAAERGIDGARRAVDESGADFVFTVLLSRAIASIDAEGAEIAAEIEADRDDIGEDDR